MSTERLQSFKNITFWCGTVVTFCGIVLGWVSGGSVWSAGVALFGLLLTCSGHCISVEIAKYDKAEREADKAKLEDQKNDTIAALKELERRSNSPIP